MASDMPRPYARPPRPSSFIGYLSQRDIKRDIRRAARRTLPPVSGANPQTGPPPPLPPAGMHHMGEKKQGWLRWAGQKVADKVAGSEAALGVRTEQVRLFPGWASRRYHAHAEADLEPFDVEVYVSGIAVKEREFGILTRSQRTVMRIAKSFAALPKVDGKLGPQDPVMSPSTEDLIASMELPPRPDEIDVESELRALKDYKLNNLSSSSLVFDRSTMDSSIASSASASSDSLPLTPSILDTPKASRTGTVTPPRPPSSPHAADALKRLHRNLEARLHPFWATALPARQVRISVFAYDPPEDRAKRTPEEIELLEAPLASLTVSTTADGAFSAHFKVPWEDLCRHPRGVHVAFSPNTREEAFGVAAELLPTAAAPPLERLRSALTAGAPIARAEARIPLEHTAVRIISDIDDTVKLSGILAGARAAFYNVFVRDLRENVIRGMGEWYQEMWSRGARFHYVSNGPFELLPVIEDFLALAQLPPGSIRLRLYSTRTLFNGLLSAPASRKRAGVEEILSSFPTSRFILVGDSGEQDLELYAEQAALRPTQIRAVFIRDANTYDDSGPGIPDPTGARALALGADSLPQPRGQGRKGSLGIVTSLRNEERARSAPPSPGASPIARFKNLSIVGGGGGAQRDSMAAAAGPATTSTTPRATPNPTPRSSIDTYASGATNQSGSSASSGGYFSASAPFAQDATRSSSPAGDAQSEAEKKRLLLQSRVWAARLQMPGDITLRVFREPEECIEAREVLDAVFGHGGS